MGRISHETSARQHYGAYALLHSKHIAHNLIFLFYFKLLSAALVIEHPEFSILSSFQMQTFPELNVRFRV